MAGKIINFSENFMSIQQETYVTQEPVTPVDLNKLTVELNKLFEALAKAQLEYQPERAPTKRTESVELNKLFEALAKAQLDMEVAKTDSTNPYFKSKYADLKALIDASRPFLAKNGICVVQRPIPAEDGRPYLYTRMGHLSGQWMESFMPINPPKQDIQTLGSYLTYLRRYSYSSMVGVVAGDEDDDGETAMTSSRQPTQIQSIAISKAQLNILAEELKGEEGILENMLKAFAISKLSDLPQTRYTKCIERIREIKRNREGEK
jgi:hypothetical protein